jgi:NAD(P)-dependent dehydrogenase (short-subunit alcohol dehydrogenase family)
MLLEDKVAVVYGGGGFIGGAVARDFAREGASVFLAGRTPDTLEAVAEEISAAGGIVETACLDALEKRGGEEHLGAAVARAGRNQTRSQHCLVCWPLERSCDTLARATARAVARGRRRSQSCPGLGPH